MEAPTSNCPVPTPVNLVKYIEDPDYEHEDFNLSAAVTLRARVGETGANGTSFVGFVVRTVK